MKLITKYFLKNPQC